MAKYFSLDTRGFYDDSIHKTMPSDAKELSEDDYTLLHQGQAIGKEIVLVDDFLVLQDPSTETMRENQLRKLEMALHQYIFVSSGYPVPTQTTLQAIYSDPDSTSSAKNACKEIFDWIKNPVLLYYYGRKTEINNSESPGDVDWDFDVTCSASNPGHTLSDILAMTTE